MSNKQPLDTDEFKPVRFLTYMLIAAGMAVAAWFLFAPAKASNTPSSPQASQVIMKCTCTPVQ